MNVECHAGHTYPQRPTAFTWEGERHRVEAVLAEWRTPEQKIFRVRTIQGATFDLTYDFERETWQIVPIIKKP
jgi:hypothetical protein